MVNLKEFKGKDGTVEYWLTPKGDTLCLSLIVCELVTGAKVMEMFLNYVSKTKPKVKYINLKASDS